MSEEIRNKNNELRTEMIIDSNRSICIGKSSVIGQRSEQQDAIMTDEDFSYIDKGAAIAVLCDGMGGLNGGAKASQLCVSTFMREFNSALKNDKDIPRFYKKAIALADADIADLRDDNGKLLNAGSTLVSVVVSDNNLYWASVGDSHIYVIRNDEILCITKEHNYFMILKEMVNRGELTAEEAKRDPRREALISYMGMGGVRHIDANSKPFQLIDGDYIVLCSDGLYRSVSDEEIRNVVCISCENTQLAAERLTDLAISKGKRNQDNTSAVVIYYQDVG